MSQSPEKVGAGGTANPVRRPSRLGRIKSWQIILAVLSIVGVSAICMTYQSIDRHPGELMRYAERRLIGHPKLEAVVLPVFTALRPYIERPVTGPLPSLGKGQQSHPLPPQRYSVAGLPLPIQTPNAAAPDALFGDTIPLASASEIQLAIARAKPGQVLEIAPGTYPMTRSIRIHNGGEPARPIVLRARFPGSVIIESSASEGFHLHAPYWIFENLLIRGICGTHSNCEHAFHVVGKAQNTVIRNNRIEDFNAQIKVNGLNGDWPDNGLIQYNTLNNTGRRDTGHPVTPIDIVGANNWVVADNLITNFVKADGNQVSFGVFMKGAGSGGRIERNLIICTSENISQSGTRVGASLGGGGTDLASCRDKRCITEHSQGTIARNVIAHCNDFGIYINNSNRSTVDSNTLVNTYGIDVRFPASSSTIGANLTDGMIRSREGAQVEMSGNRKIWATDFPQAFGTFPPP